ncbi:MAG: HAD-IC family P-type ATPase [Ruminococcus flavefaciens]|nr:HAD-IC family P-type ATPase [Ruminococcus flavefaciens]
MVKKPVNIEKPAPVRINAPADRGLTPEQVSQRIADGYDNKPVESPSKSTKEIISENVFTYFNFIFFILACLLVFVGSYRDMTFIPIIIANTLIGIFQELRSKKTLDKLTMLNAPVTTVIRDGKEMTVQSQSLVLDDIAVFRAGNQISADAIILDGSVSVNESLLTGEADEIIKSAGDTLMSGSFVVSGACRARLEKVGSDSYISQLTLQAKRSRKGEQSEMIRSLNRIVKIAGIIIIPIGVFMFYQQYFINDIPMKDSIEAMVAAVIGMVPEGLFLIASTTLAISAMRLAMGKVLVHDMKCIETLARVDVLCVDKTGTITENSMSVNKVIPLTNEISEGELHGLLSDFSASQDSDNETMASLKNYFSTPSGRKAVGRTGFSSKYKYSSVTFESGSYVIGAPDFIIKEITPQHRQIIDENSRKGHRVLVFGRYGGVPDGKELKDDFKPICFILISNPIRENAPETFKFFAEQGVEIKVISGDNPVTVSEVAKQAGIENAKNYIDASTLTNDNAIYDAVQRYTVFGRVTPDQKRKFVKALKLQGRTVAMTGDGVNDVLALKDADCSVAMASGSEAAAQVSQLVLLESDFSKMPDVVMEGRRVVNNLERSGSLFLVKNIFSLIMSILTICFGITYPLKPSQISLISLFTIGIPALVLSQMPNQDMIRGKFMTNILLKAFPAGITDTIIVAAMVFFGNAYNVDQADIATASTILLCIVGLMILFEISRPMNVYKMTLWIFCIFGLAFCMVFVSDLFGISGMSTKAILLCINFSIIAEPFMRYLTMLFNKIKELFTKSYNDTKKEIEL